MSHAAVRGQPLVALLAVLGGWIGGRAATWEPPTLIQAAAASEQARTVPPARGPQGFVADAVTGPQSLPGMDPAWSQAEMPVARAARPAASEIAEYAAGLARSQFPVSRPTGRFAFWNPPGHAWPTAQGFMPSSALAEEPFPAGSPRRGPGYSGLSRSPSLSELAQLAAQPAPPGMVGPGIPGPQPSPAERTGPRRWSADAWTLMRRGGGTLPSGALPATYGATQAGAVLRYRIAPRNRYRPTAYLRTTSTVGALQETSAALGLSARPLPAVPIVAAIEARIIDRAGTREFQPVAMAVTEIPPFELPLAMRGEAYGQAGYVGGRFATPFADGQFRFDRDLLRYGAIDVRAGGGVWGGVQKGAGRLDFGPSAVISMPLGQRAFGRVSLDWRFRVAGNARPGSGPAATLSAGF